METLETFYKLFVNTAFIVSLAALGVLMTVTVIELFWGKR